MGKNKPTEEINPEQAAKKIGVSTRTIINFIRQKRFEAVKVSREWYIDEASFISFCKRYNYQYESTVEPVVDENKNNILSENININAESVNTPTDNLSLALSEIENKKANKLSNQKNAKKDIRISEKHNIKNLRSFQLLSEAVNLIKIEIEQLCQSLIAKRCVENSFRALEELSAGYYSFGADQKVQHYKKARNHLSSVIAVSFFVDKPSNNLKSYFENIAVQILPAITALIRKIENTTPTRRNKYDN